MDATVELCGAAFEINVVATDVPKISFSSVCTMPKGHDGNHACNSSSEQTTWSANVFTMHSWQQM